MVWRSGCWVGLPLRSAACYRDWDGCGRASRALAGRRGARARLGRGEPDGRHPRPIRAASLGWRAPAADVLAALGAPASSGAAHGPRAPISRTCDAAARHYGPIPCASTRRRDGPVQAGRSCHALGVVAVAARAKAGRHRVRPRPATAPLSLTPDFASAALQAARAAGYRFARTGMSRDRGDARRCGVPFRVPFARW